jgi:hypothetical protein
MLENRLTINTANQSLTKQRQHNEVKAVFNKWKWNCKST